MTGVAAGGPVPLSASIRHLPVRKWPGWAVLLTLPAATVILRSRLSAWCFMWSLAAAIFWGCKWQTWWQARPKTASAGRWRSLAYLFAWPGMDAEAFLGSGPGAQPASSREWIWAGVKTLCGAALIWGWDRRVDGSLAAGWVGMLGIVLILHFGAFHILSLVWRSAGVNAQPIMLSPLQSTSLSEFWGRRWNLGFRQLTHELILRPLRASLGATAAMLGAFVASGLVHDLVISFPARGGYGLPTAYFILQGCGILVERSQLGKRLGLGSGARGWFFTLLCAAGPAGILFHPWFVERVMAPFLIAIGAR